MKKIFFALYLFLVSTVVIAAPLTEQQALEVGSGPGNGTDYVAVLFANAREEVIKLISGINVKTIRHLEISDHFKEWLLDDINGSPRFIKFSFYAAEFNFKFQDQTCPDGSSICFYNDNGPLIVVSNIENYQTTEKQAMIMLLHEIGHFTGEVDHLFLDRFAAELVASSEFQFVVIEQTSKRYSPNIFDAANLCEMGRGEQVSFLKERASLFILEECIRRSLICKKEEISYTFSAQLPSLGMGFDSVSTCTIRAFAKGKMTP